MNIKWEVGNPIVYEHQQLPLRVEVDHLYRSSRSGYEVYCYTIRIAERLPFDWHYREVQKPTLIEAIAYAEEEIKFALLQHERNKNERQ